MAQKRFYDLFKYSDHIIAMDGHLDKHQLDIFERYLESKAYVIHNQVEHRHNHCVQYTKDREGTMQYIMDCIANNERVVCPCLSKTIAEQINKQAENLFGTSKKIQLYTSDRPLQGGDIAEIWGNADLVIFTSTIDCGVSFEIQGHFNKCICFFDNKTGPTCETCVQMMSLSRDTRKFLICLTINQFVKQEHDPQKILNEMSTCAEESEIRFHGIRSARCERGTDWTKCNGFMMAHVMNERAKRMSRNYFLQQLTDILQEDGAKVMGKFKKFNKAAKKRDKEEPSEEATKKIIDTLEMQYNFTGFDANDKDALKRYSNSRKLSAYKNLCMLKAMGPNFQKALAQKKRDVSRVSGALQVCRQTQKFEGNALSRAEVLVGAVGQNYDIDANRLSAELLEIVTGSQDPFDVPILTTEEIGRRLQCQVTMDDDGNEITCASHDIQARILSIHREWINQRPELHTPFRYREPPRLTVKDVLQIVRHMVKTMYDMDYTRQNKENGFHLYKISESDDFTSCPESCKTKPIVPLWADSTMPDIPDQLVLEGEDGIVQPTDMFRERQADRCKSLQKRPFIQPENLFSCSKRRKVSPILSPDQGKQKQLHVDQMLAGAQERQITLREALKMKIQRQNKMADKSTISTPENHECNKM